MGDLALNINNQNLMGKSTSEVERLLKSLPNGSITVVAESSHSWAKRAADLMRISPSVHDISASSASEISKLEDLKVLSIQVSLVDVIILIASMYHLNCSKP